MCIFTFTILLKSVSNCQVLLKITVLLTAWYALIVYMVTKTIVNYCTNHVHIDLLKKLINNKNINQLFYIKKTFFWLCSCVTLLLLLLVSNILRLTL